MYKVKLAIVIFISLPILIAIVCFYLVKNECKAVCYSGIDNIPKRSVALVLGTNPFLANGNKNLFYSYRIKAAINLYQAKKVEYILVSGDNGHNNYDEVSMMRSDLMKAGIPADKIYRDYAGFRTLDSIVRAKEIFNLNDMIIVSQAFHNERALFIARHRGIENAIAYNAQDVQFLGGFKTKFREVIARIIAVFDVMIHRQPKFLGERIIIGKDLAN